MKNNGVSLNLPYGSKNIRVSDKFKSLIGIFDIDGKKYKPDSFKLLNIKSKVSIFNGTDYMSITPTVSNSRENVITAKLHFKIDDTDVIGSPKKLENIPKDKEIVPVNIFEFPLSNISKGNHILTIELIPENSDATDSWLIPFSIENEFIS